VGEDPFQQPPVELEIVGTGEKQPEQKPKAEKVHQQPPLAQKARVKPQQEKRVTLDLFSPEALQIIDGLKLTTGTEENRPTFNKLLEIVKRRFH